MYETEETSDIIGAYCTLIEDYQGICDAQIVGDYGTEVVVRLSNGIEMATHRDEVIVFDWHMPMYGCGNPGNMLGLYRPGISCYIFLKVTLNTRRTRLRSDSLFYLIIPLLMADWFAETVSPYLPWRHAGSVHFLLGLLFLLLPDIFCRRFTGCGKDCGTLSVIFPIIHYPYGHRPWTSLSWVAVYMSTYSRTHIYSLEASLCCRYCVKMKRTCNIRFPSLCGNRYDVQPTGKVWCRQVTTTVLRRVIHTYFSWCEVMIMAEL